jgi:phenolic acid decarboxylase
VTMSQPVTEPTYRGNTFLYSLPNGWSFRLLFSADGSRLRMEGLTGEHAGQAMELEITVARVAHGVYFINWIKPDGGSVSHVHDYHRNTVQAFWSFERNGERVGQITTGTIQKTIG